MHLKDLDYSYPDNLVALSPHRPSRVMWVKKASPREANTPAEIKWSDFIDQFTEKDLIVMNDTKVLPSLMVTPDQIEVHMIQKLNDEGTQYEVLFPARDYKIGEKFALTKDHEVTLKQKGLPQVIEFEKPFTEQDFFIYGKPALPPYILKLRETQRNDEENNEDNNEDNGRKINSRYQKEDEAWYQSAWAEKLGSVAAPTASLHFSQKDIEKLKSKNVQIEYITLHVGMGTFLPVKTEDLSKHVMHKEWVEIPKRTLEKIKQIKQSKGKVWALGTTVTRSLEAQASNHLVENENSFSGHTDLLIQPPYQFKIVDNLMTNFHQPKTTLLALVAAFAGTEEMKNAYQWAIKNNFKLFSYGDLSVWTT